MAFRNENETETKNIDLTKLMFDICFTRKSTKMLYLHQIDFHIRASIIVMRDRSGRVLHLLMIWGKSLKTTTLL